MSIQLVPAQQGFYGLQFDRLHRKHHQVSIVAWEVFMDGSGASTPSNAVYVGPELSGQFMSVVTIQSPDGSLYDPLTRTRYANHNNWLAAQFVNLELNIKGAEQDGITTFGELQTILHNNRDNYIQIQLEPSDIEGRMYAKPLVKISEQHADKSSLRVLSSAKNYIENGIPRTILFLS